MTKSVASGNGNPGATLTYNLSVANVGTRDASGVTVEETVPSHTTFFAAGSSAGWTCSPDGSAGATCTLSLGTVAVGATLARSFAVVIDAGLPANPGNIDNTACVSTATAGDPPGDNCGSTTTPPGGNPDLRTTKSLVSGSGEPGEILVYDLMVSNIGNRGAAGVLLSETVPALATFLPASSSPGWSCSPDNNAGSTCVLALGSVAAGASVSRTFAVQVAATFPADPPPIDNTACSSTSTPADPAGNNCGSVSTPPGGNPDLRTTKSLESGSGEPGATLLYDLMVSNIGNRDAANVSLSETVPALATFLPASSSPGWSCSPDNGAGSTCVLALGSVAAGASASRTFAVQLAATFPASPPLIDNTACSSTLTPADPAANNCGSVSTPPGGNPDLSLSKSVVSGSGDPGATLVYSLLVANLGNRDAAGVELTETVPQLTSYLSASSSPGWTCTPDGNAGSSCRLAIGTVAAGTSATYTFAVQVASTFPPNPPPIDNTACASTASGGDPAGNDCASTSTPPGGRPDLVLSKALTSGTVVPNGVLVFTLTLQNQGSREATDIVLQETVLVDSTFEPSSSSPGWSCTPDGRAGAVCTLDVGTVAAGVSSSHLFAVRLSPDFWTGTSVSNTACVSQAPGANDTAGSDCTTVVIDPPESQTRTDVEVAIGVDGPHPPGKGTHIFTLNVRNASAVTAEGLRVLVSLPSFGTEPTELDPACEYTSGAVIECTLSELTGGESVFLAWKQVALQFGDYTVSAELIEATPEDVDSTPDNGVKTEDDYAEVLVSVSVGPELHEIPTLSSVGISVMVVLLVGLGVVFLKRGATRRETQA